MRRTKFIQVAVALFALLLFVSPKLKAEGEYAWPANYDGVMLQGFSWDAYDETQWSLFSEQASEMSNYFDLIWVPNSGKCSSNPSMGYNPVYWFTNHNSSFGTEEELREMIRTFNAFGTGIIEDVVVNHRNGATNWTDFPAEEYKGETYQLGPDAICRNDEVASAQGQATPTGAYDTGDNFDGARDLDHTNPEVQRHIKAYLDFLKNDLGYAGWRYDMVKGFGGEYVKIYNESAKALYSVGEYWDNYDKTTAWIEKTGRQSAAFDFEFKWALGEAFSKRDFTKLIWKFGNENQPAGLVHNPTYKRYAVTFIDNHDTYREASKFKGDVLAANAYLLTHPGTPCVFMKHWLENKDAIKTLIAIRKAVGVHNQSKVEVLNSTRSQYVAKVTGLHGELIVKLGMGSYTPAGYTNSDKVASASAYTIWTKTPVNSLDVKRPEVSFSPEGGFYQGGVKVTMTLANGTGAESIAYTVDGSFPSATNGTVVKSGATVDIVKKTTLRAVAIADGKIVSGTKTAVYKTEYLPVTIYLQKPSWSTVNFYAWSDEFEAAQLLGNWPGKNMASSTVEQDGYTWYKYTTPQNCDVVNIIFNNGTDQTVDITGVEGTKYYVLNGTEGKSITVTDVTSKFGGVSDAVADVKVAVYPNPATDMVFVKSAQEVASFEVYAASGALVARSENAAELNVASLQNGFYFYRVALADGIVAQGKLLKK